MSPPSGRDAHRLVQRGPSVRRGIRRRKTADRIQGAAGERSRGRDRRSQGNRAIRTRPEPFLLPALMAVCLSGVRQQHEVEPQRPDPPDLRQGGDGEAVGLPGPGLGSRFRLVLPAEPASRLPGERRGVVRPAGPRTQTAQHARHVSAQLQPGRPERFRFSS